MNISKLLLSTTLIMMSCSSIYASNFEELGINNFTYDYLSKYSVESSTGALYRDNTETSNKIYPTYENQKLYDLKTYLEIDSNIVQWSPSSNYCDLNVPNGVPFNLVVKKCDDKSSKTYTLTSPIEVENYLLIFIEESTNLIIPQDTTLDCNNVRLIFDNIDTSKNILILGTITNKNQTYNNNYLCLSDGKTNVILGPQATYDYNMTDKYSPIIFFMNIMNFILYPGCTMQTSNIDNNLNKIEEDTKYNTIDNDSGNLFLNRYIKQKNTDKLVGTIHQCSHIVYPTTMIDSSSTPSKIKEEYKLTDAGDDEILTNFVTTSYFPLLYWNNASAKYYNENLGDALSYHFEKPELPLEFVKDKKRGNKEILKIKEDIIAKCDVLFWDQCSYDNKDYGFSVYNTNTSKYIDTNTIEDLFYKDEDSTGTGLLQNMPNEILVGLIGDKDIEIKESDSKNILLLGDNSGYNGTMTIPDNITDIYWKTISKINNIRYKNKTYANDEIPGVTFHYIDQNNSNNYIINNCKHIWDLAKKGNELKKSLSNNDEIADNTIILLDSGEVKTNTVKITGDNSEFKGVIITTPDVKKVIFGKNSFVRTIDINGKPLKYTFTDNNNVTDYNDYSVLNSKNGAKVNITSNNRATHLKNERKTLNINTDKINVHKYGSLTFEPGTKLRVGKK